MKTNDASDTLPLSAIKVIEMHAIGPVPFAGMVLQQLGATVTRISPPTDPGLGVNHKPEFDLLNLGKPVVKLDLKTDTGQAALHEELAGADIMLEGFRPGVLERLNLAPADLLVKHSRLVVGRLSGWGNQGAYASRAGHDINYLALAGILHGIGSKEDPAVPLNVVGDFGGGAMYLLLGVMAKLIQRGSTGTGGLATTSILAGSIGLTPMFFGLMAGGRWNTERANNLLDGATPFYRTYRTSDGRHVAVGALENKFFKALLEMTGLTSEFDAVKQYDTAHWPGLTELLTKTFAARPMAEWASLSEQFDACVSPVLNFLEAAEHPHNQANDWYTHEPYAQPRAVIDFD
ncbi:MAG: CaiB/BaiF CoA transferase family protein [Burkholderiaceae bacterium]